MNPYAFGVVLGVLGIAAFIVWVQIQCNIENNKRENINCKSQNRKKAMSTRGVVILIMTAIVTLVLFVAWVTGPSFESTEICGGCGGSGWFFSKVCPWCQGTGYEKETIYPNWWCFWVGLVVLCSGTVCSFLVKPKNVSEKKQKKIDSRKQACKEPIKVTTARSICKTHNVALTDGTFCRYCMRNLKDNEIKIE